MRLSAPPSRPTVAAPAAATVLRAAASASQSLRRAASAASSATSLAPCAASTHPGEEASIVAAHGLLRDKFPTLLTVIVPRHPARGEGIAEIAKAAGLAGALRSQRAQPMPDVAIYIADTLGELGLIYRVAPIVFMGGSLASHGGQNPIEAVRLGAAVLHGPHV